jgi:hypothetical protein
VRATREALVASIQRLQSALDQRTVLDKESIAFLEARMLQQTIELSRFDRDVAMPAEEVRLVAIARVAAFAAEMENERRIVQRASRPRLKRKVRSPYAPRPRRRRSRLYRFFMSRVLN